MLLSARDVGIVLPQHGGIMRESAGRQHDTAHSRDLDRSLGCLDPCTANGALLHHQPD